MANQKSKNKTNSNNKNKAYTAKKVNKSNSIGEEKIVKNNAIKKESKRLDVKEEAKVSKVVKEDVSGGKENKRKEFKLTSRQKDLILILLVVILFILAIFVTISKTPKLDIELPIAVEGEPGFTEITYAEYEAKMAEEKPFLMVLVQDGCGYCDMYKPVVEEVSKEYGIPTYYINLTNLNQDDKDALSSSNSYLKKNKWGTPTTLFMYGDVVVDYVGGYVEKEEFISFVKENIKVDHDAE